MRQGTCIAAISLVGVVRAATITADDNNAAIEYRGTWVRKTLGGPVGADLEHSYMFTNTSGSTATYKFQGTAISLYGMFQTTDTSNINSTYSIDRNEATDLAPVKSNASAEYCQKLFQSDTLSDEGHTLVIAITGQDFALNYLVVTLSPLSTATTLSKPNTLFPSPTEPSPPIDPATASLPTSSAPQSQTSVVTSGIASPTSTFTRTHSTRFPESAIAGFSIAGTLVLIMAGLMGCIWHYWKEGRIRRRDDVMPYDPSLTALAFEASAKQDLVHDDNSGSSAADAVLSLAESAPAYPQSTLDIHISKSAREDGELHEIRATNLGRTNMGSGRRTVFEPPPGSPSTDAPPVLQQVRQKGAPTPASAGPSRYGVQCEERRRSVDGGVRLAGGPLDDARQDEPYDDQEDIGSGVSTLPPVYRVYQPA
ncbi:hypothetical protein V8D89_000937 [Ganoderma adspersum]